MQLSRNIPVNILSITYIIRNIASGISNLFRHRMHINLAVAQLTAYTCNIYEIRRRRCQYEERRQAHKFRLRPKRINFAVLLCETPFRKG